MIEIIYLNLFIRVPPTSVAHNNRIYVKFRENFLDTKQVYFINNIFINVSKYIYVYIVHYLETINSHYYTYSDFEILLL